MNMHALQSINMTDWRENGSSLFVTYNGRVFASRSTSCVNHRGQLGMHMHVHVVNSTVIKCNLPAAPATFDKSV